VSDLIKRLRINYNKLLIKKRESKITREEKHAIVAECIDLIGTKYNELIYKHDGCRVLQSLLKYGNRVQRSTVVENIKEHYLHLMTTKYSHYLASKAYYYAPE
jgi:pumilio family protein 6